MAIASISWSSASGGAIVSTLTVPPRCVLISTACAIATRSSGLITAGMTFRERSMVFGSSASLLHFFGSGTGLMQTMMFSGFMMFTPQLSAARETTSLPISVVPPAETQTMASRKSRCTGYSFMVPQPPWISIAFLADCTAASVT